MIAFLLSFVCFLFSHFSVFFSDFPVCTGTFLRIPSWFFNSVLGVFECSECILYNFYDFHSSCSEYNNTYMSCLKLLLPTFFLLQVTCRRLISI